MKFKFHPVLLGAFVLGAIALAITALVFLGQIHVFSRPQYFAVYFHQSVSGLEKGSAVKMQGVRIGRVDTLNVVWNPETRQTVVVVICQVDRESVNDTKGHWIDITSSELLPILIEKGLRARMTLEGVTGLRFVALEFVDPAKYPARQPPAWLEQGTRYPAVPAIESSLSAVLDDVSQFMNQLKRVDLAGISAQIAGILTNINQQVVIANNERLVTRWAQTGQALQQLATSPQLSQAVSNLDLTLAHMALVTANADTQISPAVIEFRRTLIEAQQALKSVRSSADNLDQMLDPQHGLGEEAVNALRDISEAAQSIRRLAELLERNPNAIITGSAPQRPP